MTIAIAVAGGLDRGDVGSRGSGEKGGEVQNGSNWRTSAYVLDDCGGCVGGRVGNVHQREEKGKD